MDSIKYRIAQVLEDRSPPRRAAPATKLLAAPARLGKFHAAQPSATIQSSSVVERSAVNRLVVGSNPTSGANFKTAHDERFLQLAGPV